jgi:competence protein ComEC
VVLLLFLWTGLLWFDLQKGMQGPAGLSQLLETGTLNLGEPCRITGTCLGSAIRGSIGEQYTINLELLENGRHTFATRGKVRLSYFYPSPPNGTVSLEPEAPEYLSLRTDPGKPVSWSPSGPHGSRTPILEGGDRVEILVRLKQPRNFRNDGAFNAAAYLEQQGIYLAGSIKDPRLITAFPERNRFNGRKIMARIRGSLLNRIDSLFGKAPEMASMLRALLIGEKNNLPARTREDFQATGTYHVLVVSGQHVAILAACLIGIVRLLCIPRAGQFSIVCGCLGFYALLAEGQPSIVRATVMTAAFLIGWLLDRGRNGLNSLSLACFFLLLANPCWLLDAGFQLSFLAVFSILFLGLPFLDRTTLPIHSALRHLETPELDSRFSPPLADFRISLRTKVEQIWRSPTGRHIGLTLFILPIKFGLYLVDTLLISLAVQMLFFVLMLFYFNRVSFSSILVNLFSVPLVGIMVPLGFMTLLVSYLIPWAIPPFQYLLINLAQFLLETTHFFASPDWGNFRRSNPSSGILAINLASLMAFGLFAKNKVIRSLGISGWIVSLAFLLLSPWLPKNSSLRLSLTMLDVHQGDALVLELPGGKTMLIDGGGMPGNFPSPDSLEDSFDIGEKVLAPFLWARGINRIDYLVATHPHHDHAGGLFFIVENFQVGEIWTSRLIKNTPLFSLAKKALQKGTLWRGFAAGEQVFLDEIKISCLNPPPHRGDPSLQPDEDSLVFLLQYRERSFLLTADAGRKTEEELTGSKQHLRADVLKVAHHGSRSASSRRFLQKVAPVCSLISVGPNNPFQHPHPEVLERLKQTGAQILRTDQSGAIKFSSNGRSIALTTFADENPGR